jgi:hypothetical protein
MRPQPPPPPTSAPVQCVDACHFKPGVQRAWGTARLPRCCPLRLLGCSTSVEPGPWPAMAGQRTTRQRLPLGPAHHSRHTMLPSSRRAEGIFAGRGRQGAATSRRCSPHAGHESGKVRRGPNAVPSLHSPCQLHSRWAIRTLQQGWHGREGGCGEWCSTQHHDNGSGAGTRRLLAARRRGAGGAGMSPRPDRPAHIAALSSTCSARLW